MLDLYALKIGHAGMILQYNDKHKMHEWKFCGSILRLNAKTGYKIVFLTNKDIKII